ncbi:hypothetical protein [Kitasatospora sp. NPDC018619]|uniref:hypothetical protein n=1 Tax=unclassified Kitasatospora TaxID=2633591 RepID=UPI0037A143D2
MVLGRRRADGSGDEESSMAQGSGYAIQAGGAEAQANALDKASEDEATIGTAISDPVCYTADVFGGEDADPAYRNFSTSWQAESATIKSALSELAGKVRSSSAGYRSADGSVVKDLATASRSGDYRPFG